jgi:hypothetical protein
MSGGRSVLGGVWRWAITALLVIAIGWPGASAAVTAPTDPAPQRRAPLILLVSPNTNAVFTRVRAELRSLGFDVEVARDAGASSSRAEIEVISRGSDAAATIQIAPDAAKVGVWLLDRSTGRATLAALLPSGSDPALVALRAVEALRASLIDVHTLVPNRLERAAPAPSEPIALPTPRVSPTWFGASFGPALAVSAGRIGISFHALAVGHWMPSAHFGLEVLGLVPLTSARWSAAEGTASLSFGLMGLGARYRPIIGRAWSVDVAAVLAAARLHGEGVPANDGFFGDQRDTWMATPLIRLGAGVEIAPSLRLRAEAVGAATLSPLVYTFADGSRATWARPLVIASIGLEVVGR